MHSNCLQHANHRIVRGGLLLLDDSLSQWRGIKYYSSLCKLVHVMRDMAKDVFSVWNRLHGACSAVKHGKTLVPRPIAGRWGSVHDTEERLVSAGEELVKPVVVALLTGRESSDKSLAAITDDGLAEHEIEEQVAYRRKLGRWRRDTLNTVTEHVFWLCLMFSHKARQPLQSFMANSFGLQITIATWKLNTYHPTPRPWRRIGCANQCERVTPLTSGNRTAWFVSNDVNILGSVCTTRLDV